MPSFYVTPLTERKSQMPLHYQLHAIMMTWHTSYKRRGQHLGITRELTAFYQDLHTISSHLPLIIITSSPMPLDKAAGHCVMTARQIQSAQSIIRGQPPSSMPSVACASNVPFGCRIPRRVTCDIRTEPTLWPLRQRPVQTS